MKILVLGASGFIGNACYNFFSKNNAVTGIDLVDKHGNNLIIDEDTVLTRKLIEEKQFDAVVNCAGSANIQNSFVSPENDFQSNTAYVESILTAIKEKSPATKFINISSAAVYGNPDRLPISEEAAPSPLSPYGTHKLLSEHLVTDYHKLFNVNALSVRIFSAYGNGLKQQFFFDLYSKFKSNSNGVMLFGTGKESRDFIFISDIVAAFDLLIEKGEFNGSVYNLASGTETFIGEAANLFANIINYKGKISFNNQQLSGYPLNWRADISKLNKLGFSTRISLKEGLSNYANWLKTNYHS
jgi:UDP-glucose 4-epimerase